MFSETRLFLRDSQTLLNIVDIGHVVILHTGPLPHNNIGRRGGGGEDC